MKKAGVLRQLFLTMLKIGLFTFGGGYAMLALLENEFVSKRKWIAREEFLNMVAISESTPGPIASNAATYIGYQTAGIVGSVAATVAVCIPSFVIIFGISLFFDAFLTLTLVSYAFRGIQACVVYLILSAGLKLLRNVKRNPVERIVLCGTVGCMLAFSLFAVRFSSVLYILIGGTVGLCTHFVLQLRKEDKK